MIDKNILPSTANKTLSMERHSEKVTAALLNYVYTQIYVGLLSSIFCGLIVYIGLLSSSIDILHLSAWFILLIVISGIRAMTVMMYRKKKHINLAVWRKLYIFGAFLGGLSWGLPGIFFFHNVDPAQQTLLVLMLAGVSAGAVSLSGAVPQAAIAFLFSSIFPYIISIIFLDNLIYLLFDCAMTLYLLYSIVLSIKAYQIIKKSILLQFENDDLLKNLTEAKAKLEKINKELEQTATHDPLTQVANRALFKINLEEALRRAKRNNNILGLMYLDLDKFKPINDKHGHHIGDYVLLIVTKRLKHFLGSNELIARLGGDEFAIIIENANNTNEIISSAKMICELMAAPIQINNLELQVYASLGISIYPDDATDSETLIKRADSSMYRAKMQGGNNFHLSRELT